MIWRTALSVPRYVEVNIEYAEHYRLPNDPKYDPSALLYWTSWDLSSLPLTSACSEARAVALEYYTRAFAEGSTPRYTYVNFDIDTIILHDEELFALRSSGIDRHSIKKLVLWTKTDWDGPWANSNFSDQYLKGKGAVMYMQNLKELTFLAGCWPAEFGSAKAYELELRRMFKEAPGRPTCWSIPQIKCLGPDDVNAEVFELECRVWHKECGACWTNWDRST